MKTLLLLAAFLMLNLTLSAQGLKASGKKIVDDAGKEVILRGMGLGGWMLQEPYMMEMSGIAGTQWEIKEKIKALIGSTNTDAFYDKWLANHCTRADIDSLAKWGFNSVRLPMHYNLYTLPVESEPVAGANTWLTKGFAMTDSLISWCKANKMYVILDLHAAPGGQGKDAAISDANPSKLTLWEDEANKLKTIALWRKLAQRYTNEPWVGGYDLINEPNWSFTAGGNQNGCSETGNVPLRDLYIRITTAIREVDTKHMLIVEGNCWGNSYSGLFPLWDNNMAVSFHKYWSTTSQGDFQWIIDVRNQNNCPVWLGESGENSNAWFTDCIMNAEKNGIGWAWWPLKKIKSVTDLVTIPITPEYQKLLDYWKNIGAAPTSAAATSALMQIAENAKIQNCISHKDVIDAMFRQVHDSTTKPFAANAVPGVIRAADYDLGRIGQAYWDSDMADYHVSTGTYTAWNSGSVYRNDGVDIENCDDVYPSANGYSIGWTASNEWLQYTADVDSSAVYTISLRYAALGSASKVKLLLNDADVTGTLALPSTGGYKTWTNLIIDDIIIYKGQQKIKVFFEEGGANFELLGFTIKKKTDELVTKAISAETHKQTELIHLNFNKMLIDSTVKAGDFSCTVNGNAAAIGSLTLNASNPTQVVIHLGQQVFDIDNIKLSYTGSKAKAVDGTFLQNFSNLQVKNNLPVYNTIPGLLEAESFIVNQGLVLETTTDIGGGKNIGYTTTGDYLDYQVRVSKTSKYTMEIRVASAGAPGSMQLQQLDANGAAINSVFVDIPYTGGWQTWQTITSSINLAEGVYILRLKIVNPEFNINWIKFTENSQGIDDDTSPVFSFYPNPASEEVTVEIPGSQGKQKTLTLLSYTGKTVKKIEVSDSGLSAKMFVGDLPGGIYLMELEVDGSRSCRKLIIK